MPKDSNELPYTVFNEDLTIEMDELCRACDVDPEDLREWIEEGVIEISTYQEGRLRFTGVTVARIQRARRLQYDLGLNAAGVALALDLLDEIAKLRVQLRSPERD